MTPDEDFKPGSDGNPAGGGQNPRISLRRLDKLMQGELSREEAEALRASLEGDPAALAYLRRQEGLRSSGSAARVRAALARRSLSARLRAWAEGMAEQMSARNPAGMAGLAGALACLALAAVAVRELPRDASEAGTYRAKGGEAAELLLRHRGRDYASGDLVPARSGDTLSFSFRGGDSAHVQAWYREEDGPPAPFAGGGFVLPPSSSWTEPSRRLLLDGQWSRQEIWILLSRRPLDAREAAATIRSGASGGGKGAARVLTFRLAAPQ